MNFEAKQRVRYVPHHAYNDTNHKDCEDGTVSSFNEKFVFVKFDRQTKKFGWDGTTSEICDPNNLIVISSNGKMQI